MRKIRFACFPLQAVICLFAMAACPKLAQGDGTLRVEARKNEKGKRKKKKKNT